MRTGTRCGLQVICFAMACSDPKEEGRGSAITHAYRHLLVLVLCSSTPPQEPRAPLAPVETLCGWLVSA